MKSKVKLILISSGILLFLAIAFYIKNTIWNLDPIIVPIMGNTQLLFLSSWSTTKQVQSDFWCKTVVNGSYFGYTESGEFLPAGVWYEDNGRSYSRKNYPFDLNLTTTIRFYQKSKKADVFFDQSNVEVESWSVVFNAGPRLVQSGEGNLQLQQSISHWQWGYPRTVIAKKGNNQIFLVLSRQKISLSQLANWLQSHDFYDAINLDWGPSTAITSKSFGVTNFNEEERLSIFFCIR